MIDKNKELQQKTKTHNGDSERARERESLICGEECRSYATTTGFSLRFLCCLRPETVAQENPYIKLKSPSTIKPGHQFCLMSWEN